MGPLDKELGHQEIGERLEPLFAGDGGLGPARWFEGQVEVFETRPVKAGVDFGAQFASELALLLDGVENAVAALGQGGEVLGAFVHRFELGFVEIAGDVLAVTGHEGDGGSRVEQLDGALHLFVLQRDFLRNAAYEF